MIQQTPPSRPRCRRTSPALTSPQPLAPGPRTSHLARPRRERRLRLRGRPGATGLSCFVWKGAFLALNDRKAPFQAPYAAWKELSGRWIKIMARFRALNDRKAAFQAPYAAWKELSGRWIQDHGEISSAERRQGRLPSAVRGVERAFRAVSQDHGEISGAERQEGPLPNTWAKIVASSLALNARKAAFQAPYALRKALSGSAGQDHGEVPSVERQEGALPRIRGQVARSRRVCWSPRDCSAASCLVPRAWSLAAAWPPGGPIPAEALVYTGVRSPSAAVPASAIDLQSDSTGL